jgi:hypothetical protein
MTTAATSWVYIFSKFTSEALLFETLLMSLLVATYATFYVMKKRRHGVLGSVDQEIPAGLVKGYLNELMADAEQLRAQLFGLLATQGAPGSFSSANYSQTSGAALAGGAPGAGAGATATAPAEFQKKMSVLETKMTEQAKALETVITEKKKIESELAAVKTGGTGVSASSDADLSKLKEQIKLLETKLAEYSVIEDDLANLKRLQQENAQLKSALSGKAPEAAPAAPPVTETVAETPAAQPISAAATTTATAPASVAAPASQPVAPAKSATPATAPVTTPSEGAAPASETAFEGLVDQVEQSIATATPAVAESSTTQASEPTMDKSDADLVAEFEKMLNG